jgi:hypothetical protein
VTGTGAYRSLRIAVTGGRNYDSWHMVAHALRQMPEDATLVHGAASGADRLCAKWWEMQDRTTEPHPADWTAACRPTCKDGHRRTRPDGSDYCPAEGHYRNQRMVDSGLDLLIAFPGGAGTADMVRRCKAAGVSIITMPGAPSDKGEEGAS